MTAPLTIAFERRSRYHPEGFSQIKPSLSAMTVKGLYPRRGLAFIAGQMSAGKTFIALDHWLKVAVGGTVMGRKTKHLGVIYVAAEDPDGCRTRIDAWKKQYPTDPARFVPFSLIGQAVDLNDPDKTDDLQGAIRDIVAEYEENGFELGAIVFDTLAQCTPGADENSGADMGAVLATIQGIATSFDALAVVVAHYGKNATAGIRGWSGMGAAGDTILPVIKDEETGQRRVVLQKVKNGRDGEEIAFTLKPGPIGVFDEDGDEIWSCTVVYDGPADKVQKSPRVMALKPAEELMLSAIRYITDNGSTQPPPALLGVRAGTKAVRKSDVYGRVAHIGFGEEGETDAAFQKRRSRALMALQAAKRIRVEGDLLWLV